HLDLRYQVEVAALLRRLNRERGMAILLVSHDLNLASEVCDRLLLLAGGRPVATGAPEVVLGESLLASVFGCEVIVDKTETTRRGLSAFAIVTVGLSNRVAAGSTPIAAWAPSTINAIVIVDGAPEPAALVNAVMTVTEVKTALLADAEVRCDDGRVASGTSTDAVVVAATGRGTRRRFGGPISDFGWVVARAARSALGAGIRRWMDEHP